MFRCFALAALLLQCVVSDVQIMNTSNVLAECPGMLGKEQDGDDVSIFLQRGEALVHAGFIQTHSFSRGTPFKPNSEELNPMYDMYAGLILTSLLLALFFIVYMLMDNSATLGLPIGANDENHHASLLNNAKFVLVTMVIFDHTSQILDKNFGLSRRLLQPWDKLLFCIVYPLCVRTLCFISGILSRSEFKAEKILIRLFMPLLGFCFVIGPLEHMQKQYFGARPDRYSNPLQMLFNSGGQLQWYLVALMWWRSLGALISSFHPCVRILAAYLLAAMVTYVATDFLSLNAIGYFPAFVAGQLFPYDQALSKLQWRPITPVIGLLTLVAISSLERFSDLAPHKVLVKSRNHFPRSFDNDIVNPVDMPLFWLRDLAKISIEILKSIVFLFLVCPQKKTYFTFVGQHSIYPYLLHPFVLPWLGKAVAFTPWLKDRADISVPLKVIVAVIDILICVGVSAMLASRPVRFAFSFLIEPTWIRNFYITDGGKANSAPQI